MLSLDRKIVVLSNVNVHHRNELMKLRNIAICLGSLATGKKVHLIRRLAKSDSNTRKNDERPAIVGHYDHILAIAISTDGQFLVKIKMDLKIRNYFFVFILNDCFRYQETKPI